MLLHEKESFLDKVLRCIRFPLDREKISLELANHIADKTDYYREQGYSQEVAASMAVENMGDAKEIGRALNKQHKPFLGWLWLATNGIAALLVFHFIINLAFPVLSSVLSFNKIDRIPASDIVYQVEVNEKVKLDDGVIRFTDVVYDKNGDLNIFYQYYDTRLWGLGWGLPSIGTISDNLGNRYLEGGSTGYGGIVSKHIQIVSNFSAEADTLIIEYDFYNRKYKLEIPLQAGGHNG
jgi:hypothetical protein